VLFTCAGQRVDIVTAFKAAGATTLAADANPLAPALYQADRLAVVPTVGDAAYLRAIVDLVRAHAVDVIVPLHDLDQLKLARARGELDAIVLLPDAEVVERMRDKYLAHRFFEARGIGSPLTWLPDELPAAVPFPVLVKERYGYGSRNLYPAADEEELDFFLKRTPVSSIVQATCAGNEFSIDVLCDFTGRCLNAIPRTMIESKGGESIKGRTIDDADLIELGRHVAEAFPAKGPATIQCFRDPDGTYRVTDVNPRFGGAFPLPLCAGSRYPELVLALVDGKRVEPRVGEFRAGVVMTRFPSSVCLTAAEDGAFQPLDNRRPRSEQQRPHVESGA
jgi:carbamoyl-phosphate synthase large subunit